MGEHGAPPVSVVGVSKTYEGAERVTALADVSLRLARGEMVALMGPSGGGKSTLLNLIGCQDRPTSGVVSIDGIATTDLDEAALARLRRERIGMVFQAFHLLDALSVLDNVALPLVLQGRTRAACTAAARDALALVGMAERETSRPSRLSGGQQQRVAIARAIVHEPAVLLADEATGNLDEKNAAAVLALLRACATRGQAVLIATHDREVALACDRVVRLRDGKLDAED